MMRECPYVKRWATGESDYQCTLAGESPCHKADVYPLCERWLTTELGIVRARVTALETAGDELDMALGMYYGCEVNEASCAIVEATRANWDKAKGAE